MVSYYGSRGSKGPTGMTSTSVGATGRTGPRGINADTSIYDDNGKLMNTRIVDLNGYNIYFENGDTNIMNNAIITNTVTTNVKQFEESSMKVLGMNQGSIYVSDSIPYYQDVSNNIYNLLDLGLTGASGVAGDTGVTGPIGFMGGLGNQGLTGISGFSGRTGANMSVGYIGSEGEQGNQGNQGNEGNQGNQGNQGNEGNEGNQGNQGNQGNSGNEGNQGNSGNTGNIGESGILGNPGNTGRQGNSGNEGSTGNQGNGGNTGVLGGQGNTGVGGNTGSIGMSGTNGVNGVTGTTGNTGNSGVSGVVGNSGNEGIVGNNGNQGNPGNIGNEGNSGVSGRTGVSGIIGANGYTGASGNTGNIGESGRSGASGNNGNTGNIGVSGISGITGMTGNTGATGDIGASGMDGFITTNMIYVDSSLGDGGGVSGMINRPDKPFYNLDEAIVYANTFATPILIVVRPSSSVLVYNILVNRTINSNVSIYGYEGVIIRMPNNGTNLSGSIRMSGRMELDLRINPSSEFYIECKSVILRADTNILLINSGESYIRGESVTITNNVFVSNQILNIDANDIIFLGDMNISNGTMNMMSEKIMMSSVSGGINGILNIETLRLDITSINYVNVTSRMSIKAEQYNLLSGSIGGNIINQVGFMNVSNNMSISGGVSIYGNVIGMNGILSISGRNNIKCNELGINTINMVSGEMSINSNTLGVVTYNLSGGTVVIESENDSSINMMNMSGSSKSIMRANTILNSRYNVSGGEHDIECNLMRIGNVNNFMSVSNGGIVRISSNNVMITPVGSTLNIFNNVSNGIISMEVNCLVSNQSMTSIIYDNNGGTYNVNIKKVMQVVNFIVNRSGTMNCYVSECNFIGEATNIVIMNTDVVHNISGRYISTSVLNPIISFVNSNPLVKVARLLGISLITSNASSIVAGGPNGVQVEVQELGVSNKPTVNVSVIAGPSILVNPNFT